MLHALHRYASPVSLAAIGLTLLVYVALTVQHPIRNFDDIPLAQLFEARQQQGLLHSVVLTFVAPELSDQYRTYSASRVLHLLLFRVFGRADLPYYLLMALLWAAGAGLIYVLVRDLEGAAAWPLSATGLAAATLWLFSPFSICRTFHHFSYIVWPALLLLLYLRLLQTDRAQAGFAVPLLIVLPLSGEGMLIPLVVAISFVMWCRPSVGWLHIRIMVIVLIGHLLLLWSVNHYSVTGQRFLGRAEGGMVDRVTYFLASIGASVAHAYQIGGPGYEPYFPGQRFYAFGWSEGSSAFVALAVGLSILYLGSLTLAQHGSRWPWSRVVMPAALVGAMWALYLGLAVSGAVLFGRPFALQSRLGYVVLPATAILLLLGAQSVRGRTVSLLLPLFVIVPWSLIMAVVQPTQAAVDRRLIAELSDARSRGARFALIAHPEIRGSPTLVDQRRPGMFSPFLLTADTPFQQDWTGMHYLERLGLLTTYAAAAGSSPATVRLQDFYGVWSEVPIETVVCIRRGDEDLYHPRRPVAARVRFFGQGCR